VAPCFALLCKYLTSNILLTVKVATPDQSKQTVEVTGTDVLGGEVTPAVTTAFALLCSYLKKILPIYGIGGSFAINTQLGPIGRVGDVEDVERVGQIVGKISLMTPTNIWPIGMGKNSVVWGLTTRTSPDENLKFYIVKTAKGARFESEYLKETHRLQTAAKLGIPSPIPLAVGKVEDLHYMVQTGFEGLSATTFPRAEQERVWKIIGRHGSSINSSPVTGWGPDFSSSQTNWTTEKSQRLTGKSDKFIDANFLIKAELDACLNLLSQLHEPSQPCLCHGDLSLANTIIDLQSDRVAIIDWGNSQGSSFMLDLAIAKLNSAPRGYAAFITGYGLVEPDLGRLQPNLEIYSLSIMLESALCELEKSDLIMSGNSFLLNLQTRIREILDQR